KHEPSILRLVSTVKELKRAGVRGDGDAVEWIVRSQSNCLSGGKRQRLGVTLCFVPLLDVPYPLWIAGPGWNGGHSAFGVARHDAEGLVVYRVCLIDVAGGQKLEIVAGAAHQTLRQRLVEIHAHTESTRLGGDHDVIIQVVIRIRQISSETIVFPIGLVGFDGGNGVPLL